MIILILIIQMLFSQEELLYHQYSTITETCVINNNTIYAKVISKPYLFYTKDSGKNWKILNFGTVEDVDDINYDGKFLWVVCRGGILFKVNPKTNEIKDIDVGYFGYKNNGSYNNSIAIQGNNIVLSHFNNKISLSRDYGKSWIVKDISKIDNYNYKYSNLFLYDNILYLYYSIDYSSNGDKNYMISGNNFYVQTINSTNNKSKWVKTDDDPNSVINKKPDSTYKRELFLQSTDFGDSWSEFVEVEDKGVWNMKKHKQDLWIYGVGGILAKTSDNGVSWEWFDVGVKKSISDIEFVGDKLLLGIGFNTAIVKEFDYKSVKNLNIIKTIYEDENSSIKDIELYDGDLYISGGDNGRLLKMKYK